MEKERNNSFIVMGKIKKDLCFLYKISFKSKWPLCVCQVKTIEIISIYHIYYLLMFYRLIISRIRILPHKLFLFYFK